MYDSKVEIKGYSGFLTILLIFTTKFLNFPDKKGIMHDQKSLDGVAAEEKERTCPDCGSTDIGLKGDEYFCKKCGLVLD